MQVLAPVKRKRVGLSSREKIEAGPSQKKEKLCREIQFGKPPVAEMTPLQLMCHKVEQQLKDFTMYSVIHSFKDDFQVKAKKPWLWPYWANPDRKFAEKLDCSDGTHPIVIKKLISKLGITQENRDMLERLFKAAGYKTKQQPTTLLKGLKMLFENDGHSDKYAVFWHKDGCTQVKGGHFHFLILCQKGDRLENKPYMKKLRRAFIDPFVVTQQKVKEPALMMMYCLDQNGGKTFMGTKNQIFRDAFKTCKQGVEEFKKCMYDQSELVEDMEDSEAEESNSDFELDAGVDVTTQGDNSDSDSIVSIDMKCINDDKTKRKQSVNLERNVDKFHWLYKHNVYSFQAFQKVNMIEHEDDRTFMSLMSGWLIALNFLQLENFFRTCCSITIYCTSVQHFP